MPVIDTKNRQLTCKIVYYGTGLGGKTTNLRYIHKRRFLMFVEESIAEGTHWAVFEPNDERLWAKIIRSATGFLHDLELTENTDDFSLSSPYAASRRL